MNLIPQRSIQTTVFPRLIQIGSFYLPTYGFLAASGVLMGIFINVRNAEKKGINGDDAWNLAIFVVLAGLLGAKVLYVINDWSTYANNWREIFSLNTLQAGGVFSGGLIAALITAVWYVRRHHMPALGTCDGFAPGVAFGHILRPLRLFRGRLLLRQAHQPFLGRHLHQSVGAMPSVELRSASGFNRHS